MGYCLLALVLSAGPGAGVERAETACYLGRPVFDLEAPATPASPYVPQPGDIFLASDRALWARAGHWLVGGAGVHHSGIVFRRSDGRMGLIEAGPFNSVRVEVMDPIEHMRQHVRSRRARVGAAAARAADRRPVGPPDCVRRAPGR